MTKGTKKTICAEQGIEPLPIGRLEVAALSRLNNKGVLLEWDSGSAAWPEVTSYPLPSSEKQTFSDNHGLGYSISSVATLVREDDKISDLTYMYLKGQSRCCILLYRMSSRKFKHGLVDLLPLSRLVIHHQRFMPKNSESPTLVEGYPGLNGCGCWYFQHNPDVNTIFVSKLGDTWIDPPGPTCLIQISSHWLKATRGPADRPRLRILERTLQATYLGPSPADFDSSGLMQTTGSVAGLSGGSTMSDMEQNRNANRLIAKEPKSQWSTFNHVEITTGLSGLQNVSAIVIRNFDRTLRLEHY
ncbi:hypothetical protein BS47DRAFT_1451131 [Hydnum rufescens UP504]|uniref:ERCC3/RAD25/XPB helicase C-terminal domain-containing protein n=1 Tax=Hydnum rufescens UP504 TaxID=1448309 RepID=A0A9P6AZX0_9AGAM|nr:hypothetical protein BS47DRAFT_1451131 [Hydnum rufescens UP504]